MPLLPLGPGRGGVRGFINIRLLILVALVGGAAYYYGGHQDEVNTYVREQAPRVAESVQKTGARGQELFQQASARLRRDEASPEAEKKLSFAAPAAPLKRESAVRDAVTLAPSKELPSQIRVCSFNIRIFSDKSRSDDELDEIADVLKYYDLIAVQELRDEKVLQRTVKQLARKGLTYLYDISPDVGRGVKERYAFLYRKDRVQLKTAGQLYREKQDEFIREPYYATFQSGNFDFILLTVHLLFGDNKDDRRKELVELATVYKAVQLNNPQEEDIILLGDFNFAPTDDGWQYLKTLPTMTYLIAPPEKTTISDTSLYDNFWFQKNSLREYTGRSGVNRFDENMFRNDDRQAQMAVSDHRPIWADFRTDMSDDD